MQVCCEKKPSVMNTFSRSSVPLFKTNQPMLKRYRTEHFDSNYIWINSLGGQTWRCVSGQFYLTQAPTITTHLSSETCMNMTCQSGQACLNTEEMQPPSVIQQVLCYRNSQNFVPTKAEIQVYLKAHRAQGEGPQQSSSSDSCMNAVPSSIIKEETQQEDSQREECVAPVLKLLNYQPLISGM